MKVNEILNLVKAGYKASEIKALIDQETEEAKAPAPESTPAPVVVPAEPAPEVTPEVKPEVPTDFEALYNKTLEELTQTQEKLAAAQAENRNRGVVNPIPTLEDEFKKAQELFRR